MLTSALMALIKNPIKESFYGKRKKKVINILTIFFISYKNDIKTFLKWIVNQCLDTIKKSFTANPWGSSCVHLPKLQDSDDTNACTLRNSKICAVKLELHHISCSNK